MDRFVISFAHFRVFLSRNQSLSFIHSLMCSTFTVYYAHIFTFKPLFVGIFFSHFGQIRFELFFLDNLCFFLFIDIFLGWFSLSLGSHVDTNLHILHNDFHLTSGQISVWLSQKLYYFCSLFLLTFFGSFFFFPFFTSISFCFSLSIFTFMVILH